jgi:molecular chaperone DnaK
VGYGLGIDIGTAAVVVAVHREGETEGFELVDEAVTSSVESESGPPSDIRTQAAHLTAASSRAGERMGAEPDRVALTYPARQGRAGRDLMDKAAHLARLDDVVLLSDLEAAARRYARQRDLAVGDPFLVYDLGAGAVSTVVMAVTPSGVVELAPVQTVEGVGGAAFDELVLAHIDRSVGGAVSRLRPSDPEEARAKERLDRECDRAKRVLSESGTALINVLLPDPSDRSATGVRQSEVHLTRDAFEAMIVEPLGAGLEAVHRALEEARTRPDQLAGVLLIGGSSRIPLVAAMLTDSLGVSVRVADDPDGYAALGAALVCVDPGPAAGVDIDGAGPAAPVAILPGLAEVEAGVPDAPAPAGAVSPAAPPRRRRAAAVAVAAAAVLLVGGGVYLTQGGSSDTGASLGPVPGRASASPGPSRTGLIVVPTDPAGDEGPGSPTAGPTGRADGGAVAPTTAAEQSDPAGTTSAKPGAPTAGAGTTRPGQPTQGPVPTSNGSGVVTPSVSPTQTAKNPDDVVRIGLLCFDSSRLEENGQYVLVACPRS